MRNLNLGLTPEQLAGRKNSLGGSDANILLAGDDNAILRLYQEKTGEREGEDLSKVLPVQMGSFTEEFNRYWFELQTGREVTHDGLQDKHPEYPFMHYTRDGVTTTENGSPALFEAKHVNAFSNIDEVIQRYMPQLHHGMAVLGLQYAVLSVFLGTLRYEFVEVERDDWYLAQLIDRERAFWAAVETGTPPVEMAPIAAPVPVSDMREVDMDGNNGWSLNAGIYIDTKGPAKQFKDAEKALKELVEDDVKLAHGYGVQCKRSSNGALRLSEMKK
jgi:predicted phage-related endonuclease